jgi:paraquat-inducible protein B
LPAAVPDAPQRLRVPLVWILPVLVVLVGAFVAVREKVAEGTSIEITFRTADDLEPNKTKISYKAVEIGEVKEIRVSKDRKEVIVEARIHRNATDYLVEDTRFWVVRPRITGTNISGLGTLVSGAYIGVDVGHSAVPQHHFVGLEVPPIVTSGLPGREFVLHAGNIGSLNIGSGVYYRRMTAGQVVAYALDPGGDSVTIKVFINSPYDRFVTGETRFWQASGVDMSIDSEGVKLHTEALASILEGGIAFQSPRGAAPSAPAPPDNAFPLFSDRERAMREVDTVAQSFVMYFQGSLRGLSVGAPVELRGINIGEVKALSVEYDRLAGQLRFPVVVDIFPERIRGRPAPRPAPRSRGAPARGAPARGDPARGDPARGDPVDVSGRTMIDSMVAHGMRAEIKTGNLLTGQKYVAVDVEKGAPRDHVFWDEQPPIFPTAPGALDEIQDSIGSIAKKLDNVPFDQISARLLATMASLDETLKSTDRLMRRVDDSIAPEVDATLKEAQAAMKNAKDALSGEAPLQHDLGSTLLDLSRAAKSVSALADYLERHPESLIRGKPADRP